MLPFKIFDIRFFFINLLCDLQKSHSKTNKKTSKMSIATEIRIGEVERILSKHYEPECHSKCYLNVWRHYIFPQMGISQRTFTRYLKIIKDRKRKI